MTLNSKHIKISILLFMLICFLLPFVAVSCHDAEIESYSSIGILTSDVIQEETADFGPDEIGGAIKLQTLYVLILIVLVLTLLLTVYTFMMNKFQNIIGAIVTFINFILLIIIKLVANDFTKTELLNIVQIKFKIGYWLMLLLNIVYSVYCTIYYIKNKNKQYTYDETEQVSYKPLLVALSGVYKGNYIELPKGKLFIGRDPESCQLVFNNNSTKISRIHCSILFNPDEETFYLEDYSSNGTYLKSGERLIKQQVYKLHSGDIFYLGDRQNTFAVKLEIEDEI